MVRILGSVEAAERWRNKTIEECVENIKDRECHMTKFGASAMVKIVNKQKSIKKIKLPCLTQNDNNNRGSSKAIDSSPICAAGLTPAGT